MNALIIFSISLGLTVTTSIVTMTQVPIESVALKLFTGIEKWEIMAVPFFILACSMFALVCGSSVATVVAIGSIVLPAMVAHGYPMRAHRQRGPAWERLGARPEY